MKINCAEVFQVSKETIAVYLCDEYFKKHLIDEYNVKCTEISKQDLNKHFLNHFLNLYRYY